MPSKQLVHILVDLIFGDSSLGLISSKSYNYAIAKRPILTLPHVQNCQSTFFLGRDIQTTALNAEEVENMLVENYSPIVQGISITTSLTNEEAFRLSREYNAQNLSEFNHRHD